MSKTRSGILCVSLPRRPVVHIVKVSRPMNCLLLIDTTGAIAVVVIVVVITISIAVVEHNSG